MLWSGLGRRKHLGFLSLHDGGKTYRYRKWVCVERKLRRLLVLERFERSKDGIDEAVKIFAAHEVIKKK
jgi:hypothetical protein